MTATTQISTIPESASLDHLFCPLDLGGIPIRNRFVMAPMTRQRAEEYGTPDDLMITYFAQRASAGLLLTDCTAIQPLSHAYPHGPGIYSDRHIAGWKRVTNAVPPSEAGSAGGGIRAAARG